MKAIVTDDSRATRLILKKILEELKFEVELMEDGGALLNTLTEQTPDLCLIDWNMPGMNGTEVIRAMRSHPDWCDIPAILVTDEKLPDRIDSALEAGASAYLAKPFKAENLQQVLDGIGL
jgi:two-component system chemotaxis response regulator CheY